MGLAHPAATLQHSREMPAHPQHWRWVKHSQDATSLRTQWWNKDLFGEVCAHSHPGVVSMLC